jgi:penicillin-binding protein 1C
MEHRSWFVLPPSQEFYFRRHHAEYRPLPPFRNDCTVLVADAAPIDFLYPHAGTSLYIPLDLGAKKGRAVFEAVHREPGATLFWHLDDRYLGATETFHQQALDIAPGVHVVTVVDGAEPFVAPLRNAGRIALKPQEAGSTNVGTGTSEVTSIARGSGQRE